MMGPGASVMEGHGSEGEASECRGIPTPPWVPGTARPPQWFLLHEYGDPSPPSTPPSREHLREEDSVQGGTGRGLRPQSGRAETGGTRLVWGPGGGLRQCGWTLGHCPDVEVSSLQRLSRALPPAARTHPWKHLKPSVS